MQFTLSSLKFSNLFSVAKNAFSQKFIDDIGGEDRELNKKHTHKIRGKTCIGELRADEVPFKKVMRILEPISGQAAQNYSF
jgi:hypothetical protein